MCFFERTDYTCGDWKWGNMIQRCHFQHRIGETCGTKLLHEECKYTRDEPCKHCKDIDVKKRRKEKLEENIRRWTAEKDKFAASLAKAVRERAELVDKIRDLERQRPSVQARENGTLMGLDSRFSLPSFENRTAASGYTTNAPGPNRSVSAYTQQDRPSGRHALPFRPNVSRG